MKFDPRFNWIDEAIEGNRLAKERRDIAERMKTLFKVCPHCAKRLEQP